MAGHGGVCIPMPSDAARAGGFRCSPGRSRMSAARNVPPGGRLFDLSRLEALEPRAEHFAPRGHLGPHAPITRPIAAA